MKHTRAQFLWGPDIQDKITFNLKPVTSNPSSYVVKSISGLEPPSITINTTDQIFEGSIYQGRRPEGREIIMLLGMSPNYSLGENFGDLRTKLYSLLTPKLNLPITFRLLGDSDTPWVETKGYIKRIEAPIFSEDPEVQITMSCLGPYFDAWPVNFSPVSSLSGTNPIPITNTGDAPSGFLATFVPTVNMSSFKLSNANETQSIEFVYNFLANDRIWIDTRIGFRSATRVRSGASINLLPYMTQGATWLQLHGGLNNIKISTASYLVEYLYYTPRHWGF